MTSIIVDRNFLITKSFEPFLALAFKVCHQLKRDFETALIEGPLLVVLSYTKLLDEMIEALNSIQRLLNGLS